MIKFIRMNIFIFYLIFSNILLVNSTLPGENAESSGRGQQNVGQMPNQSEHQHQYQPQIDFQSQHLEEDDPLLTHDFSQYSGLLSSEIQRNEYIDNMQIYSPQQQKYNPISSSSAAANFQHDDQITNPQFWVHNLPSGSPINFDQIASSSAVVGNEFDDWEYEDGDFQGFEEQIAEIDSGNGKGKGVSKNAEKIRQIRIRFEGILKELRKVSDKCESFPIIVEIVRGKQHVKENDIWKGTFSISRRCILVMESWMIKLEKEQKFIGMKQLLNEANISIEELILNVQQNKKILEKHPLSFMDQGFEMDRKKGEKTHNDVEAKRKRIEINRKREAKINESLKILLSVFPKGFIIQMAKFTRETIVETVINYTEFLFNLLDPFTGYIRQLENRQMKTGIGQNEQKLDEEDHESNSRKRQRNGD